MIQPTITLTITELDALITRVEYYTSEYQTSTDDISIVDRSIAKKLIQAAKIVGLDLADRFILDIGQEI